MAFENELQSTLEKWLAEESKSRSHHILNGSCSSLEEYKARCAELNTMWAISGKIEEFVRGMNDIGTQENRNGEG